MKKILCFSLACLLAASMAACSKDEDSSSSQSSSNSSQSPSPTSYTATKSGYGGDLTVRTIIENGVIKDLELVEDNESQVVIKRAFPVLKERILQENTADVDTVSGATFSSYAIKSAVADAMAQAGMEQPEIGINDKKEYEAVTLEDVTTDIIIVGGGPSGLAAAITAKETDPQLKVMVVEKLDILSGNGKFDLNFYDLFNSEAQKAQGVEDSKEQFIADMQDAGNTPERLQVWADGEEKMDAWLRSFGVTLDYNYGGRNHMATKDDYAGPMIQQKMEERANALGVEIRTGTAGTDLIFDGEKVAGITVTNNRNQSYRILAQKTIIATGGFSNNQQLLAQYAPDYVGYGTSNQLGTTGDFVPVFEKYGFALENMDKIRMIPLTLLPSRDVTNSGSGTVLVNQDGQRFVNERSSELALAEPIREQEAVWMIVDSQKVTDHANVRKQVKEQRFQEVATLDEAAQVIGCDPETLKATFADYNENATNKTEDEFGLVPERAVLEEGPYYISRAASAVHMTKGGVGCNEMAQVLYENGGVVDSLYACGEVTWQSGGYSQSVVFGRVAGENAAKAITEKA
ncbi:FAD-binding protein [Angelakisella massiliensis]|uniref:FAD-binding protein n=1 Tax=Angelakisella massiliensis TaxID=1871018 RepID=UPI0008F8138D|nr:FAD-binding protein [Angelakisella massiliensis]